jgi:hypothetical protein
MAIGSIPQLLQLAVKQDLSIYDTCYLQAAPVSSLSAGDERQEAAGGGGVLWSRNACALKGVADAPRT